MMKHKSDTDIDLELAAFFNAAKESDALPNAAFLEAVAGDALAETNARSVAPAVVSPDPSNWLSSFFRNIGGWQSVAALTACACFGIYAGYSTPDSLDYLNGTQTAIDANDDGSFSIASDIEALFLEV
jgi:hypothetical protein